jgi:hypothetical protein
MKATQQNFILGLWGVRYQVKDVQRSIAFYTQMLGFNLDHQNLPAFGQVSISNLKLILSPRTRLSGKLARTEVNSHLLEFLQ